MLLVRVDVEDEILDVVEENELLDDFFVSTRLLILGAEEFIVHVNVEDEILSFEGESVLLVHAEEEDDFHNDSSTTPPRQILRVDEESEPSLKAEDFVLHIDVDEDHELTRRKRTNGVCLPPWMLRIVRPPCQYRGGRRTL